VWIRICVVSSHDEHRLYDNDDFSLSRACLIYMLDLDKGKMASLLRGRSQATQVETVTPAVAAPSQVVAPTTAVVAAKAVTKVGEQSTLVNQAAFGSAGTLTVTPPASEGAGYILDINTATLTTGGGNVTVTQPGGVGTPFAFNSPAAAVTLVPNTVILSPATTNTFGSTPQATTLPAAIALLGAATASSPWTILVFPGTYTGAAATVPANVNLVALEPGNANIANNVTLGNSASAIASTNCTTSDINFQGTVTWSPNVAAAGFSKWTAQNCTFNGVTVTLPANTAGSVGGSPYQNAVYVTASTFNGGYAQNGGVVDIKSSYIGVGGSWTNGPISNSLLQVAGSTFSPSTFTNDSSFCSFRACTLGGAWINNNTGGQMHIDNCQITNNSTNIGQTNWTLTSNNGSKAYIKNSLMYVSCQAGVAPAYNLTQPALLTSTTPGTPGFVDRDMNFTLKQVPTTSGGGTIPVTWVAANRVPFVTEHTSVTQTADTTQVFVNGVPGTYKLSSTALTAASPLVAINIQSTFVSDVMVNLLPPVPQIPWYN